MVHVRDNERLLFLRNYSLHRNEILVLELATTKYDFKLSLCHNWFVLDLVLVNDLVLVDDGKEWQLSLGLFLINWFPNVDNFVVWEVSLVVLGYYASAEWT